MKYLRIRTNATIDAINRVYPGVLVLGDSYWSTIYGVEGHDMIRLWLWLRLEGWESEWIADSAMYYYTYMQPVTRTFFTYQDITNVSFKSDKPGNS